MEYGSNECNWRKLNAIFLNLSKVFNQTFNDVPVEYTDIAMVVPSNGAYIDYRWLANFPQMKEWMGKKHITKLAEYDYVIRNKDYAATIEVRRNDIEDDQMGIYKPQAESAAWSAKQHPMNWFLRRPIQYLRLSVMTVSQWYLEAIKLGN
jgi:phage major head subunit gpT-like protein